MKATFKLLLLSFFMVYGSYNAGSDDYIEIEYHTRTEQTPPPTKSWGAFSTMSTGMFIGALFGTAANLTDNFWPLNWIVTTRLRNLLVNLTVKGATENNEEVDAPFLDDCAWATDWLTYLTLCSLKPHTITILPSPFPSYCVIYTNN